jgi:hypothetical protein
LSTRRPASTGARWFTGILVTGVLIGLGVAFLVMSQSAVDIRPAQAAAADREFEEVRHRLGNGPPYIVVEMRDGQRVVTVRADLEPMHPGAIRTVRGIAWTPWSGRLLRVSTPYWVFQATRWKAKALVGMVRPFHQQLGLDFELPDLGPLGPGLVLDERNRDGRRVLVWTD